MIVECVPGDARLVADVLYGHMFRSALSAACAEVDCQYVFMLFVVSPFSVTVSIAYAAMLLPFVSDAVMFIMKSWSI